MCLLSLSFTKITLINIRIIVKITNMEPAIISQKLISNAPKLNWGAANFRTVRIPMTQKVINKIIPI